MKKVYKSTRWISKNMYLLQKCKRYISCLFKDTHFLEEDSMNKEKTEYFVKISQSPLD